MLAMLRWPHPNGAATPPNWWNWHPSLVFWGRMEALHHQAVLPGGDVGALPQTLAAPRLQELPLEVLEAIAASGLELRDRVALASCCAALWTRADVASSSALWGQLSFRDEHVDPRHRKAALAAWLRRRAAAVERLRLSFAALGGPASALASLEGGPLAELQVTPTSILVATEGEFEDAFEPLERLPCITRLELSEFGLDALPGHVSALRGLRELDVHGNDHLTGLGSLVDFGPLAQLRALTRLDLSRCRLKTDAPWRMCVRAGGALRELSLRTNPGLGPFARDKLLTLLELPSIVHVDLRGCNVPSATAARLREGMEARGASLLV